MSTRTLYAQVRSRKRLWPAWRHIRTNALRSASKETSDLAKEFDKNAIRNLEWIAERLRHFNYSFSAQLGIAKERAGRTPRPIVVAPIKDRIVHRSMLDTLVTSVPFVQEVLRTPTSIGGVPERGVGHALRLVNNAIGEGLVYFAKADIKDFFGTIPRQMVIDRLAREISDAQFIKLLKDALETVLKNEEQLGEDRNFFPVGREGVAQGSPLSPLFGNILLHEFDNKLNGRGIVCIRFIDDFLILGKTERAVVRAFESAQTMLSVLGLGLQERKTSFGRMDNRGVDFLGFHVQRGLLQPSARARKRLIQKISNKLREARGAIERTIRDEKCPEDKCKLMYCQVISDIDKITHGWGRSFSYSNAKSTIEDVDKRIDNLVMRFNGWFRNAYKNADCKNRRRVLGVQPLTDVDQTILPDMLYESSNKSG
ncbi:MAG TPA: hypothetical protein ENJ18_06830 [Nannocystis exedens]|nr:hypothetical protein [Nannocystis exedens]